jgi:hypothetical protein
MQRSFITVIMLLICMTGFTQNANDNIAVESFSMDEHDQEARIMSKKTDHNNKVCAIIRIETPLPLQDFTFEAGMIAVTATEQKTATPYVINLRKMQ